MKLLRSGLGSAMLASVVIVSAATNAGAADNATTAAGPTEASALAAEQEVAKALLANDAVAVGRLLDDDWMVVSTAGGTAGRADFLAAIRGGLFARKTLVLSEPRVRVYGDVAVVTTHLATSGTLGGKPFDVREIQTDVLTWHDGAWKSVLTHETKLRES